MQGIILIGDSNVREYELKCTIELNHQGAH